MGKLATAIKTSKGSLCMNNMVGGEIVITINASKEEEDGLDGIFSSKDHYLRDLVKGNRQKFAGMVINCSVGSIGKIRSVARRELVGIEEVRGLNRACFESDFVSVKRLYEKCFLEKEKDVLLKHFMKCQRIEFEKYGADLSSQRLLKAIKELGSATSSHYILSMEGE